MNLVGWFIFSSLLGRSQTLHIQKEQLLFQDIQYKSEYHLGIDQKSSKPPSVKTNQLTS